MQREPTRLSALVGLLFGLKLLLHLPLLGRYGFHGDELYFIECGRRWDWGYVDHPPLVPWLAGIADSLGASLWVLRLPAVLAGVGTLWLTALLVGLWGGGVRAQALALLSLLVAPAHLRLGAMLNIPVIEVFLCTATAVFLARALVRGQAQSWLLAGVTLGLAALTKHAALLWAAAIFVGILASPHRAWLATRWPWLGGLLALVIFGPNLAWQVDHDFATWTFMRTLRDEVLAQQGRLLFALGQLLYFHPVACAIAVVGVVAALRDGQAPWRPFAIAALCMAAFLLIAGGKPYYLASAYPPMLAAGAITIERVWSQRRRAQRALVWVMASTGAALGLITLPILPLDTVDRAVDALLGRIVPAMALTHDLHGMYGWRAHASTIEGVVAALPAHERDQAALLVASYSQAAALNVLRELPSPRAVSGHMSYFLWGPEPGRGEVLIAYGMPRSVFEPHYTRCEVVTTIDAPLARPQDTNLPVSVCRGPRDSLATRWPHLRVYGHGLH